MNTSKAAKPRSVHVWTVMWDSASTATPVTPPPSPKRCRWMWSKVAPETSIARRIARSMYRASSRWLAPQRSRSTWVPAKTCPSCSVKWSGPPADTDPGAAAPETGEMGVRVIRPPPHRPRAGRLRDDRACRLHLHRSDSQRRALSPRPPPPSRASAPASVWASAPPARRGGARGAGRAGPWPPSPGCPGSGPGRRAPRSRAARRR